MNSKILLAFVVGAVLASGIVYMAVKPEPVVKPVAVAATPANPDGPASAAQEPAPQPSSDPVESAPPESKPVARTKPVTHAPKPSPARKNVEVAALVPAAPADPAPQPQAPVVEEAQPQAQPPQTPPPAEPAPAPPAPQPPPPSPTVTIPAGTVISVRVGETISTQKNQTGDTFLATLSQPLVADGYVIAEKGARAEGRIVDAERAGRVKGVSHLTVELTKITTSDGQHIRVKTSPFNKEGATSTGTDAAKVGGGER